MPVSGRWIPRLACPPCQSAGLLAHTLFCSQPSLHGVIGGVSRGTLSRSHASHHGKSPTPTLHRPEQNMKRELSHSTPNPLARPNSLTRPNTHTPHALPTLTPPNTACNDDSLTLRRTTCISNANSTPALTSASRASRASRCPSLDTDPGVAPSLSPPPPDPPARHDPPLLSASSHIDVVWLIELLHESSLTYIRH